MGPETRSRLAARAASPTFSWQEGGGGREHFLLCTDSRGDVIRQLSQLLRMAAPGPKVNCGQGGGARAGARRRGRALSLPQQLCAPPGLQSRKRPPDPLHRTVAPSFRTHLPPARSGMHLRRPKRHFLCPILIAVSLVGPSTRNLLKHKLPPFSLPPLKPHFLSPIHGRKESIFPYCTPPMKSKTNRKCYVFIKYPLHSINFHPLRPLILLIHFLKVS